MCKEPGAGALLMQKYLSPKLHMESFVAVFGGLGYIGSSTCVSLIEDGYKLVIIDNLSNSRIRTKKIMENVSGSEVEVEIADITDKQALERIFEKYNIESVIHFAALKSVDEGQAMPDQYYQVNIVGTINIMDCMVKYNVKNMVYSSSAVVYGDSINKPVKETDKLQPINVYGRTKLAGEWIISDYANAFDLRVCLLRYFNPVGSHPSHLLGDSPVKPPKNLFPNIMKSISIGKPLNVFGIDYKTRDGSCVRDFIHVMDLADGHIAAMEYLKITRETSSVFNLGSGTGTTVMEIVNTMRDVTDQVIPYEVKDRRCGDAAQVIANPDKANALLNWRTTASLHEMCDSAWKFFKNTQKLSRNRSQK